MSKVSGKLLMFDKEDLCGHIFPKTCSIDIPESVPIILAGSFLPIGIGTVDRRDDCLFFIGEIAGPYDEIIKNTPLYFGGYYIRIRSSFEESLEIIESMDLHHVGLYTKSNCADYDLKVEVKEDD